MIPRPFNFLSILAVAVLFSACGGGGGGGGGESSGLGPVPENGEQIPLKSGVFNLPPLSISSPSPVSDQEVTVDISVAGATSIELSVSGEGCGELENVSANSSSATQTARVGRKGECSLSAEVITPSGNSIQTASFLVTPTTLSIPGVKVVNGEYFPSGALASPTGTNSAPVLQSIVAPGTLINGGTGTFQIEVDDPDGISDVVQVLVKVSGTEGYYSIPARLENGKITFDVSIDPDYFEVDEADAIDRVAAAEFGDVLEFIVQLVDQNGNLSNQESRSTELTEVGAGALQVSLSWDTATDVDLHVLEPSGEEIYWSDRQSSSGGVLDLDSNAGCDIDNTNNENVTWDTVIPVEGEYIVRVDYWSACEKQTNTSYIVTTNSCGKRAAYSGSFLPLDADAGGAGSGTEVARIDHTSCAGFHVAGRATYEDFAQTSTGLSTSSTMLPIRHAKIEVRRKVDDVILANTNTDADGRFDIEFSNDGDSNYYVVAIAEQDNDSLKQKVVNDSGEVYSKKSADIDGQQEREKLDVTIEAMKASAAPAFNIFDMGAMATSAVRTKLGNTPPLLTWLWTNGKKGACPGDVSCFQKSLKQISVLSVDTDPDEYDDLVLLHEYGHFFQNEYSRSDSPGGGHTLEGQYDPRLSWGEGSATFFGNSAKSTSLYLDTKKTGIGVRFDLESVPSDVLLGTSDATINGNISEAIVAGALWDLDDSSNESTGADKPQDTVSNTTAVFSSLSYLGGEKFADRGRSGADFVDFLDGWFCSGSGNRGDSNTGVEGIVVGIFQFPYDFVSLPSCK